MKPETTHSEQKIAFTDSNGELETYQGRVSVVDSPRETATGEVKEDKLAVEVETPNGSVLAVIDKPDI